MRELLIKICPVAIWCIVVLEILVAAMLLKQYRRNGKPLPMLSLMLTLGLILDAAVIGLGSVLPSDILRAISPVRFMAHGVLIPLLFPICAYALDLKKPAMKILWILTAMIMLLGAAQAVATVLEARDIAGVIRYAAADSTPAWAETISMILSFGTVIPMMIVGIVVWIRKKIPYLFLSGFMMFVFSALGPATGNTDLIFFISMFGELLMVWFLYLFAGKMYN